MKRLLIIALLGSMFATLWSACESDNYLNDGGKAEAHVNMTTYDFLKQHGKFDSLVAIIDRAGLKDEVNAPNSTFFATTDYGVRPYVSAKKQQRIIEVGDENIEFGIRNIPVEHLDSLKMYMFDQPIQRENLNLRATFYSNKFGAIPNVRFAIQLQRILTPSNFVDFVDYINFKWVRGTLDEDLPSNQVIPIAEQDEVYACQTSGIITTNGILHVLPDIHRLMFNKQRTAAN